MKRKLLFTLIALLATITSAQAATLINGLYYNLDATTLTAEVTYRDRDYSNSSYVSGDLVIPITVTYNYTTYPVTSIGYGAFDRCSSLTSVTIPNSVTSIGDRAFYNCSSLTAVHISDIASWCAIDFDNYSANPLYYARNLYLNGELVTDLIIPESVKTIKKYAFENCTSLTSVTIPNSVKSIGDYTFGYCSNLTSVTIPNSVTSIGKSAFSGCSRLTSVTIPNSVTSIGEYVFCNCSSLTSITIPNSVTSIGESAFYGCSSLTSVTIPNSITSIGDRAFYQCSSLTSVTIPNSVTSVGDWAFYQCTSLTAVHISNIASWCTIDFANEYANPLYYAKNLYLNGKLVTDLIIPESVKTIKKYAFENCTSLTSVTIPNSVTSIGNEAFWGCSSLTAVHISDITSWYAIDFGSSSANPLYYAKNLYLNGELVTDLIIPESVETIKKYAFYGCSSLTSVTIGNSVKSIRDDAFRDCKGLTTIYNYAEMPQDIDSCVFYNVDKSTCTLYVPANSINLYKSTDIWNDFINIKPISVYSGTCGENLTWQLNTQDSTLTISGFGEMTNYSSNNNASWSPYSSYITFVSLPNELTSIGSYAFYECRKLTSVTIGNSVKSIGDYTFGYCNNLTSVTIPNSVTSIGDYAFTNCSKLTSVTIGNSVKSIGDYTFGYCSNLTSVTIPNSVTSIEDGAFCGCSRLTSVTIPNSVTSIGHSIFLNCRNLTSITIPNSVTNIGDYAFGSCSSLTSVTIPNSVTSIGRSAFNGCSSLTAVHISDIVSWCAIDFGMFYANPLYYAKNLYLNSELVTDLIIPESVETIKSYAFYGYSSLTSVNIPNSVTSIEDYAFSSCSSLTTIYNYAKMPQNISSNVFYNVDKSTCTLYVPNNSIELYQTTEEWKDFINIKPISDIEEPKDGLDEVINPSNTTQKLIRNGNVYILHNNHTYHISGAVVK